MCKDIQSSHSLSAFLQKKFLTYRILDWAVLAFLLGIVFSGSAYSSYVTQQAMQGGWYDALEKPFFQPPSILFPNVWTTLYIMMSVAAWRIWLKASGWSRVCALGLFAVHLVFNFAWSIVFFGMQNILYAFFVIIILLALILSMIRTFKNYDRLASWLLWPYAAWVSFACLLNGFLYLLN